MDEERALRCFWAIDVDAATCQRLVRLQRQVAQDVPEAQVRWVRPEGMHATLRFLGDVEPSRIEPMRQAVAEALRPLVPFPVEVGGLGAFPSWRRASVVWVGLAAPELSELARRVEMAVVASGLPAEPRGFRAHVTLGRLRSPRDGARLARRIEAWDVGPLGRFEVVAARLYRSELRPEGARYSVLAEVPLGAAAVVDGNALAPGESQEGVGDGTGQ